LGCVVIEEDSLATPPTNTMETSMTSIETIFSHAQSTKNIEAMGPASLNDPSEGH
jgi:hypothetical protein